MMSTEVLAEEYEVLLSIFPDEVDKISDEDLEIRVEPEQQPTEEDDQIALVLKVHYPAEYPDVVPDLGIETSRGELSDSEIQELLNGLRATAEESLGMAMVFTLVSQLQDSLRALVDDRIIKTQKEAADAERKELEKEEARTRGTPVTSESFVEWKRRFDQERSLRLTVDDNEKTKAMTPKERDEFRKSKSKLTGRQLFERNRNLADEDEAGQEEGVISVDVSMYDRMAAREEEEEEEDSGVHFSDSD